MKVTVVINRFAEIGPRQTTAMLIAAMANRGHAVRVAEVTDVTQDDDGTRTDACLVAESISIPIPSLPLQVATASSVVEHVHLAAPARTVRPIGDLLLIRTSPGRDTERRDQHRSFLELADRAAEKGLVVINSPTNLWRMASKKSVMAIDERYRPASLVSGKPEAILDFVNLRHDCIIKPLLGSRGLGVIRVNSSTDRLMETIQAAAKSGDLIVQEFVHADVAGDTRVVVVGGDILEMNEHAAAIHRIPEVGEFRANLHAGGSAFPALLTQAMRDAAKHAAAFLDAHGVWLAGIDLIGDKVIEFNVFSTGGLFDAERLTGQDFCRAIVSRLEKMVVGQ